MAPYPSTPPPISALSYLDVQHNFVNEPQGDTIDRRCKMNDILRKDALYGDIPWKKHILQTLDALLLHLKSTGIEYTLVTVCQRYMVADGNSQMMSIYTHSHRRQDLETLTTQQTVRA
jgi:hypothetical protein